MGGGAVGGWKMANNINPSMDFSSMAIPLLSPSNTNLTKRRAREGGVRGTARQPTTSLLHCLTSNDEGKGISNDNGSFDEARDNGGTWEMALMPTHNNQMVKQACGGHHNEKGRPT